MFGEKKLPSAWHRVDGQQLRGSHYPHMSKPPGLSSSRGFLLARWSNGRTLNCIEATVISPHNELPSLGLVSKSLDKVYQAYKANTFRRLFTHSTSHQGYFRPNPARSFVPGTGRSQSCGNQPSIRETGNSQSHCLELRTWKVHAVRLFGLITKTTHISINLGN